MTRGDTSKIIIRPAAAEDYQAIRDVWRKSSLNVCEDGRDGEAAFRRQLEWYTGLYLVADDAHRIVGVVLGTHDRRKGWINRLAVLPEYRRRGIAARLVTACDRAIRRQGVEIVAALVEPQNHASLRLFEQLGYSTAVPVTYFRRPDRPGA